MASIDEVAWEFEPLEGKNVPEQLKSEALSAAADYLKEQVLNYVAQGKSPVEGERFPELSKDYAEEEKFGDRTPNLELTGSLMNSFEAVVDGEKIRFQIEGSQAPKAEGHNQLDPSLEHPLPRRRFIPAKNQTLKKEILSGLSEIISTFESEPITAEEIFRSPETLADTNIVRLTDRIAARLFGFDLRTGVRIRGSSDEEGFGT